jgi:hypothetical protein
MKRLLPLILYTATTTLYANPLAVVPNVIGGYTTLTDENCNMIVKGSKNYLQAYATNDRGEVTKACWYIEEDYVYFVPKSGKLRRLPIDKFEIIPSPLKQIKQNSKTNV